MKPLILNRTERTIMLTLALVLAGVSVVCEVLLFTEQTTLPIDTALAGIIGLALVCFQFLFAAIAPKLWHAQKYTAAGVMCFIIAILFAISLSATAGFFESRYQENKQTQIQNSNDYILKKSLADDLAEQQKTLTELAAASAKNGNVWYGGQLVLKSAETVEERLTVIAKLNTSTVSNTDATTALVEAFGAGRWALWIVMAALVDLCPLVAFSSYATRQTSVKKGVTAPNTETQTPAKHPNTESETIQTTSQTPATNTQTQDDKGRPTLEEIKRAIKRMEKGEIGVRAAMRTAETTNFPRTKQALKELHEEGFLALENNKYFIR